MTKQEIKTLIESDDKLQWRAAVLFAEISEYDHLDKTGYNLSDKEFRNLITQKIKEFPQIVINRQLEEAEGKVSLLQDLERRVRRLEDKLP